MSTYRRDWIGGNLATVTDAEECERVGHNWTTTDAVAEAIGRVTWHDVPTDGEMSWPMSPALAIQAAISELRLPKVTRIGRAHLDAWDNVEAPGRTLAYDLLAVEANYKNGTALIYLIDRGTDLLAVAADFLPSPEAVAS